MEKETKDDEMNEVEQKCFDTAVYIYENHGNKIPDELLNKIADTAAIPYAQLIQDYKYVCEINNLIKQQYERE